MSWPTGRVAVPLSSDVYPPESLEGMLGRLREVVVGMRGEQLHELAQSTLALCDEYLINPATAPGLHVILAEIALRSAG